MGLTPKFYAVLEGGVKMGRAYSNYPAFPWAVPFVAPNWFYAPFALIGRLRTGYIGFLILLLMKIVTACAKSMAQKTLLFCVISP